MKRLLITSIFVGFAIAHAQESTVSQNKVLAKSKNWTIVTDGEAAVKITGPVSGVNGLISNRSIRITNPRISQGLDEELSWNVVKASISPTEKNSLFIMERLHDEVCKL